MNNSQRPLKDKTIDELKSLLKKETRNISTRKSVAIFEEILYRSLL